MKKLFINFMILFSFIFTLTSCSSDSNSGSKPILKYYNIGTPPKDIDIINKAINEYLDKKNADYNVEMQYIDWGDYEKKLQLIANTGENWDLAFSASWAGPYLTLAEKGTFLDITDLLKNEGKPTYDQLIEAQIKGVSVNGKVYGVPAPSDLVVTAYYYIWNKNFVDKYNIPYKEINSLEEAEKWLKLVKENEETVQFPIIGAQDFTIPMSEPDSMLFNGVSVNEVNGKLVAVNQYKQDKYIKEFKTMQRFMKLGYISPSAPQQTAGQKYTGDSWLLATSEGNPGAEAIWSNSFGTEVVINPIAKNYIISNDLVQGKLVVISSQSKYPKQAMDFINKMNTDEELQTLLSYGIEGKHYENEGEFIKRLPDYKNYDVPAFTFLSSKIRRDLVGSPDKNDPNYIKDVEEFKAKLKPSPILGFNLNRENIKSEVINIEQTYLKYKSNLQTGAFNDEYLDKFYKDLDAAGMEKVLKEAQKQLDEFQR